MVSVSQILRQHSVLAAQTVRSLKGAFEQARHGASEHIRALKGQIEENLPIILRQSVVRSLWNPSHKRLAKINATADSIISDMRLDHSLTIERVVLKSSDGYAFDGISLFHPEYKSTTVYFLGVTERWQTKLDTLWLLHKAMKTNIVCCNIRGTSEFLPFDPKEEVLISDGLTIMRQVLGQKGADHEVRIHGKSLGGAVGLIVASLLAKEGINLDVISESSFRSLAAAVRCAPKVQVLGNFFASITEGLKFQFDAEKAIPNLRGRLVVLYREKDFVIPEPATLKAVFDQKIEHSLKGLHILKLDSPAKLGGRLHPLIDAHCRRLSIEEIQRIAAIFQESAPCAN